jgi:copper ion binding protein
LGLTISKAIEDAGFDIVDTTGKGPERPSDRSGLSTLSRNAKKHLEQCHVCQHDFKNTLEIAEAATPSKLSHRLPSSTEKDRIILPGRTANGSDHPSNPPHRLTLSVGGMTCASCATAVTQALSGLPGVHDVSVSLLGNSAIAILDNKTVTGDVLDTIKSIGYEADVVSLQPLSLEAMIVKMDGPLHVTFSVGGMTCASCSSTVTRLLSELEGVKDVSVNLLGNSAALIVGSKKLITEAQDVIESAGYEVSVVTVEPVKTTLDAPKALRDRRTVALHIDGMFCE